MKYSLPRALRVTATVLLVILTITTATPDRARAYDQVIVHPYIAGQAMEGFRWWGQTDGEGLIRAGARHEDDLDHVWGCDGFGMCTTMNHFWDADLGPFDPVKDLAWPLSCESNCRVNAWRKAAVLWARSIHEWRRGPQGEPQAYEYLGHVAHLLADLSVPAHVHEDFHPNVPPFYVDPDPFEEWANQGYANYAWADAEAVGGRLDVPEDVCQQVWADPRFKAIWGDPFWTDLMAPGNLPDVHIPDCMDCTAVGPSTPCASRYGRGLAKLLYLLYTTNQVADYFSSSDCGPNDPEICGDSNLTAFPAWVDYSGFGPDRYPPNPQIADKTLVYAMRATASLYLVFIEMVDPASPIVTYDILGPIGDDGWYTGDVSVTLTVEDQPAGAERSEYWLEGGTVTHTVAYEGPDANDAQFTLANDGIWVLRTIDMVANAAESRVKLDKTAPIISIMTPTTRDYRHSETLNVVWAATDATSGVASESAVLDGRSAANGDPVDLQTLSLGSHTLAVNVRDEAGNAATESVTFRVVASAKAFFPAILAP